MKALTQEQVDSFRYNGFLFPIPALTPDEIAVYLAGLHRLEAELGCAVADADVKWRSHAYAHSPWFNDLIRHPRILDAVEDVIGPNILVWTSTFFIKEPHSPTYAAWHQDGSYFGLEPQEQVCAWVALTDATREAGCMEQLSSRGAAREYLHAALGLANSINRAGQTIMEAFDQSDPVAMALPAGSVTTRFCMPENKSGSIVSFRGRRSSSGGRPRLGCPGAVHPGLAGRQQGHRTVPRCALRDPRGDRGRDRLSLQ